MKPPGNAHIPFAGLTRRWISNTRRPCVTSATTATLRCAKRTNPHAGQAGRCLPCTQAHFERRYAEWAEAELWREFVHGALHAVGIAR